jgi:hypothetical protein
VSESSAVRSLFDSPVDVIGDIHGELRALQSLLKKLGYDDRGRHPDRRRLVFVGDLVDRGPDSPGVLRAVMRIVEAGNAQCIVGNHDLNALRNDPEKGRAGEGWWYGRDEPGFDSVPVSAEEKEGRFLPFLRGLPAALERNDLRIVHACWHAPSIESLRPCESVIDFYHEQNAACEAELHALKAEAGAACVGLGLVADDIRNREKKVPFIPELASYDAANQMGNAVRVVTSGIESRAPDSFYSSGKWRMVERVKWWDEYNETPVVIGHYWRRYYPDRMADAEKSASDLFGEQPADTWLGPNGLVMCIDYSVGFRFKERAIGTPENEFRGCLAALRVPERQLVFDDQRAPLSSLRR